MTDMKMLAIILGRLIKKTARVLLVGWTPGPPVDFEARLSAVETLARKLDKRAQREREPEPVETPEGNGQPAVGVFPRTGDHV